MCEKKGSLPKTPAYTNAEIKTLVSKTTFISGPQKQFSPPSFWWKSFSLRAPGHLGPQPLSQAEGRSRELHDEKEPMILEDVAKTYNELNVFEGRKAEASLISKDSVSPQFDNLA